MTSMQQSQLAPRSPLSLLLIGVGLLMVIGFFALPLVSGPELGDVTGQTLAGNRGANEFDIPRDGLPLIPIAGIGGALLGLWTFIQPKQGRTTAFLMVFMGLLSLTYYIIYFGDLPTNENDPLSKMGIAFWIGLLGSIVIIAQVLIPRKAYRRFEISRILGNQESVIAIGMILMVIIVGISNPRFVSERNIADVLQGNAYIAVAAIGMSMVIITGNIDISVGSLIGVLAVVSGRLVVDGTAGVNMALADGAMDGATAEFLKSLLILAAWLVPILLGVLVNLGIGFLVTYLNIPSIVVTLGMLSILKGGLIIATNGERVVDLPPDYLLAQMRPLGIATPILFMIVLTILAALWMRYSATGRALYAVGGNREAARLSGISEQRIVMTAFMINGIFVGIASVLYATQLSIIQATPPPNLELFIITASVVGGVSILGGTGTVIGSTFAAVLLNAIRSAMVFINVSPFWIQAVQGVLILLTVLADMLRRRGQLSTSALRGAFASLRGGGSRLSQVQE